MAGKIKNAWFWDDVRESLRAQPLKTALTFTSVAIGMMALSMLLAILSGLHERARKQVSDIGADVMAISSISDGAITPPVIQRLLGLLPDVKVAGMRHFTLSDVLEGGPVQVIAADTDLPAIRGWRLASGRWLDPHDTANAVISKTLAEQHYLQPGDAITLRDTVLRVVGIMHDDGERFIMTSVAAPGWWMTESPASFRYDVIYAKATGADELPTLARRVQRDLSAEASAAVDTWMITTPETLVASTKRMIRTVQWVYGSVAALCLVLGGVTLFSLMMVNIQQRIGELGLRMAIGASRRDIFIMFLCEGLITTIAASLAGVAAGALLIQAMGDTMELPVLFNLQSIAMPIVAAVLLGLVFSWYPSHAAASISPADALRHD